MYNLFRKFALSASDTFEVTETFCRLIPAIHNEDHKVIHQLCTQELAEELKTSCARVRAEGYRVKLVNPWARVLEHKVFEAVVYTGLSPLQHQNFSEQDYDLKVHQLFSCPYQIDCRLKTPIPPSQPEPLPQPSSNPYFIRLLNRTDPTLQVWLDKFPLNVKHIDIGVLSKLRLRLTDLYSQSKVVAGEASDEEFEFHLMRFQKVFPASPNQYETDSAFQRFIDCNFKEDFFRWRVADLDSTLQWSLFSKETPS
jgi:hypothetical protein